MAARQFIIVTGSQTTCGPGVYSVRTAGVTLTLETWLHWPDRNSEIFIKDDTGQLSPNITVHAPTAVGASIDGVQSVSVAVQGQSLTFIPSNNGVQWTVIGAANFGVGLGTLPSVQNGDPIPNAGSPFFNSSGYITKAQ